MLQLNLIVFAFLQITRPISSNNLKVQEYPAYSMYHNPQHVVASPVNLLNPDKYEYFTTNQQGDIIKRLMTHKEIQSIIASNNVQESTFNRIKSPQGVITNIVSNIKTVLHSEILLKNQVDPENVQHLDGSDVILHVIQDENNASITQTLPFETIVQDHDRPNLIESVTNDTPVNFSRTDIERDKNLMHELFDTSTNMEEDLITTTVLNSELQNNKCSTYVIATTNYRHPVDDTTKTMREAATEPINETDLIDNNKSLYLNLDVNNTHHIDNQYDISTTASDILLSTTELITPHERFTDIDVAYATQTTELIEIDSDIISTDNTITDRTTPDDVSITTDKTITADNAMITTENVLKTTEDTTYNRITSSETNMMDLTTLTSEWHVEKYPTTFADNFVEEHPTTLTPDTKNSIIKIIELLKAESEKENISNWIDEQFVSNETLFSVEYMEDGSNFNDSQVSISPFGNSDDFTTVTTEFITEPTTISQDYLNATKILNNLVNTSISTVSTSTVKSPTPINMTILPAQSVLTENSHKIEDHKVISLAHELIRQADAPPFVKTDEHPNVANLINLLSSKHVNMLEYVHETATIASDIKFLFSGNEESVSTTETTKVLSSSIRNDVEQPIAVMEHKEEGSQLKQNDILNHESVLSLFEKLGESQGQWASKKVYPNVSVITQSKNIHGHLEWTQNIKDNNKKDELIQFLELCNEIGIDFYKSLLSTNGHRQLRTVVFSPFSAVSLLAMLHLGARGATADHINNIIGLDEMTSFNPHLTLKEISTAAEIENSSSLMMRILFSDKKYGKLQTFFKEKVKQLYAGYAEEVSYDNKEEINERLNVLLSRPAVDKEIQQDLVVRMTPPMSLISVNHFEVGCPVSNADSEMFFHIIDVQGKRKLIVLPAVTYASDFSFGYFPEMDITVASISSFTRNISTIFIMPGQQGGSIQRKSLDNLEKDIFDDKFFFRINTLKENIRSRANISLQLPNFDYQSISNISDQLYELGLSELFQNNSSNFKGLQEGTSVSINLSDFLQVNRVAICTKKEFSKQYKNARLSQVKRERIDRYLQQTSSNIISADKTAIFDNNKIRFDKPFIFFVQHNPSNLILYVGRFNPVQ